MKTCVIDCGGGLRGIYGAGFFDYCLDNDIKFDTVIGISAGSANLASFTSGQRGRNYKFYHEYPFRKEYMSVENLFKKKSYLDLNYIYAVLSNEGGENPLDYKSFRENKCEKFVVVTEAKSGEAKFLSADEMPQNDYWMLKASSCIPIVCAPIIHDGNEYYDGGIGEPIPLDFAIKNGCDKIVVIWTKPIDTEPNYKRDETLGKILKKKYPGISKKLMDRGKNIKASIALAKKLSDEGKVMIISPESIGNMSTLTKDKEALDNLYKLGYKDAEKIKNFI